jgi:hypothetical protein
MVHGDVNVRGVINGVSYLILLINMQVARRAAHVIIKTPLNRFA